MEQELFTFPQHLSSPPVFSGVRVTRSLVLWVCFVDRCLSYFFWPFFVCSLSSSIYGFCRGRDRMIVGFTLYMIKFVSNLRQVGRFPRVFRFPPDLHDLTEILLKVALKHHNTNPISILYCFVSIMQQVEIRHFLSCKMRFSTLKIVHANIPVIGSA